MFALKIRISDDLTQGVPQIKLFKLKLNINLFCFDHWEINMAMIRTSCFIIYMGTTHIFSYYTLS
jgi:hypothetical protein